MCLWVLTACLGLLPVNPAPPSFVVVPGLPAPILQPTTTTTTTTTTSTTTTTTTPPPVVTITQPSPTPPTVTIAPTTATTIVTPTTTTTTTTTSLATNPQITGGMLLPVIICQTPSVVCVANPVQSYAAGSSLPIDPRLGTTPVAPAALQLASITGYSGRVPVYDTAVRFPKERRSLRWFYEKYGGGLQDVTGKKHIIHKRQTNCACVPAGTCPANGSGNFGNGLIDVRIVTPVQCGAGLEYCCTGTTPAPNPSTPVACGQRQTVPAPVVRPSAGQADFGEYPWMVMILTKQNDYISGGVLIDSLNVLTVVHRLTPYIVSGTAPNVKVRLGEWDAAGTYEPVPFQEYTITKVFTHPSFNSGTLQYDIAVLRLANAVPFTPATGAAVTINRACLPPSAATTYTGQRCWVSGWGKDMFGQLGQYQAILKEVEVPIVNPATCQTSLRTARLGANFILDTTSFICAGGEVQRDSCTGDGGSPLVCQVNGQWVAVGLVSWGLGCAASGVPGVYVNLAALLPWIQQQVSTQ